jgi:thymidylate kinase
MGSIFVTFDGPKGVGKSTLMRILHDLLKRQVSVASYEEKIVDPYRKQASRILRENRNGLTLEHERRVVEFLVRGREYITREIVVPSREQFVLFDRWYPSEAAFRRHVSFDECMKLNHSAGVAKPALVLAVLCHPRESWRRMELRERGHDSLVIRDYADHWRSTESFRDAAQRSDWTMVDSHEDPDSTAEHLSKTLMKLVD